MADRLQPEKKSSSRLSGRLSVFGSGDYDRKKKFQSSVWRVVLLCQFLVLAITTGIKKSSSHLSGGLCCASTCIERYECASRCIKKRRKKKIQSSTFNLY